MPNLRSVQRHLWKQSSCTRVFTFNTTLVSSSCVFCMRYCKLHVLINLFWLVNNKLKGSHETDLYEIFTRFLWSHIQVKNGSKIIGCQLQCKSQTTVFCVICNNDTYPVQSYIDAIKKTMIFYRSMQWLLRTKSDYCNGPLGIEWTKHMRSNYVIAFAFAVMAVLNYEVSFITLGTAEFSKPIADSIWNR